MEVRQSALAELLGPWNGPDLKRDFRDRYELRAYVRAVLLARHLLEEPTLMTRGRVFLEKFVRQDPQQQSIYRLWDEALQLSVDDLVTDLLKDDPRGATLRETAPVFVVISADQVRQAITVAA